MRKGTIIKPFWGFEVGDTIYIKPTSFLKQSVDIFRTKNTSSFVVTTWDIEMLSICVKFEEE